jgi:acetyl esterase/lipase
MTPLKQVTFADVAPELRGPVRIMTRLPRPIYHRWTRALIRAALAMVPAGKVAGVTITQQPIPGGTVRLYRPSQRHLAAALYWIHGGGMVIGRAVQNDQLCAETARELGILVIGVEYRKAPEHPFPAALDDCVAGWEWVQREADRLEVYPARVVVGGQSAGGGLAASLTQRLLDTRSTVPLAQWLFCPMLDDRTAAHQELDAVGHFVWNNRENRFGWRSYLNLEPGAEHVPAYAVPARRENVRGLPPMWLGVGDIELFYAEDVAYAQRLGEAGVPVTLEVISGAPHAFEVWASHTSLARTYVQQAQDWLRQTIEA